jgi:hypothetical protein
VNRRPDIDPACQGAARSSDIPMSLRIEHAVVDHDDAALHRRAELIWPELSRILLFEELLHELLLNLIQLPLRHLQNGPVFIGSFSEDVFETNGGALNQQFRIFSLLLSSATLIWIFSAYPCTSLRVSEACKDSPELSCRPGPSSG